MTVSIFDQHLQRIFCAEHCSIALFVEIVVTYWTIDAANAIDRKIGEENVIRSNQT
jgi:hypothetical protein